VSKKIPTKLTDEFGNLAGGSVETQAPSPTSEASIDDLLKQGLRAIEKSISFLSTEITKNHVDREIIGSLKDCMTMLHELKKKEKELLDNMSDEELERLVKKSKK